MSDDLMDTLRATVAEARAAEASDGDAGGAVLHRGDGGADAADAQPEAPVEGAVDAADVPGRARGPDGKFAKAADVPKGDESETPAPKPGAKGLVKPSPVGAKATTKLPAQADSSTTATPQPPASGVSPKYKAPAAWKLDKKEKWSTLPEDIQEEIDRRERDIAKALQESSEPKKLHDAFNQVVAPYRAMLGNVDPVDAVGSLFQTAYALRTAPPVQKAQLVARMIRDYGVDPNLLADAYEGSPGAAPQGQPQHFDPESLLQQAEQRMYQRMQHAAQQAAQQRDAQELETLRASKEFLDGELGQRVEARMKAVRGAGVVKTWDEAYDAAIWAEPEVRAHLLQRERAQRANAAAASTQRAQAASSSLKSQPAPPPPGAQSDRTEDILREEIAKARRGT